MTTTPQSALLSAQNPLLKRCYTMSESHLSGYRVVIGFERLEDAQDAHEYIAKLQAPQEPAQDRDEARAALSARKPLTDEQMLSAINETSMSKQAACGYPPAFALLELARAVERAHGIGLEVKP